MQDYAKLAISLARERGMYLVLDADGLYLVGQDASIVRGYHRAVLTPNIVEFKRLSQNLGLDPSTPSDERASLVSKELGGVTVLQKGSNDTIAVDTTGDAADLKASQLEGANEAFEKAKEVVHVDTQGGKKRCGGQGDVLSGSVGTIMAWGKCYEDGAFGSVPSIPSFHSLILVNRDKSIPASRIPLLAAIGGSILTRTASRHAFAKHGRALVTADMIPEIGSSFSEIFDQPPKL